MTTPPLPLVTPVLTDFYSVEWRTFKTDALGIIEFVSNVALLCPYSRVPCRSSCTYLHIGYSDTFAPLFQELLCAYAHSSLRGKLLAKIYNPNNYPFFMREFLVDGVARGG